MKTRNKKTKIYLHHGVGKWDEEVATFNKQGDAVICARALNKGLSKASQDNGYFFFIKM